MMQCLNTAKNFDRADNHYRLSPRRRCLLLDRDSARRRPHTLALADRDFHKMIMILLLFLQKQNLASAIYLFGLDTLMGGDCAWDHINCCPHHSTNLFTAHEHVFQALERSTQSTGGLFTCVHVYIGTYPWRGLAFGFLRGNNILIIY